MATDDGGRTWHQQLRTPAPLIGLDFTDPRHGWAVAGALATSNGRDTVYGAALFHTADGGATWTAVGEPANPLGEVDFVNPTDGWGITQDNHLAYSGDSGATWQLVGTTTEALSSVCFAAPGRDGWIGTAGTPLANGIPQVLHTTDAGKTWVGVFTGSTAWNAQTADIGCAGTTAWVVFGLSPGAGQRPAVVERTADDGAHWSAVMQPADGVRPISTLNQSAHLSVIDSSTAVFSSDCPACSAPQASVAVTRDGGATSNSYRIPASGYPISGLAFIDPTHGWVSVAAPQGAPGTPLEVQVSTTTDGGRTWSLLSTIPVEPTGAATRGP